MVVRNFERNSQKVLKFPFVTVSRIYFQPALEMPILKHQATPVTMVTFFSLLNTLTDTKIALTVVILVYYGAYQRRSQDFSEGTHNFLNPTYPSQSLFTACENQHFPVCQKHILFSFEELFERNKRSYMNEAIVMFFGCCLFHFCSILFKLILSIFS